MGSIINAFCTNCGYHKNGLRYGIGFSQQQDGLPALDQNGEIVIAQHQDNPALRFYTERSMYKDDLGKNAIQSGAHNLNPHRNLCPACGEYALEWTVTGEWD